MNETLRVVLCVGQVRVLTCVLVSFFRGRGGETERGRECSSALPCPFLREPTLRLAALPVSFVCGSRAHALSTHGIVL